MGERPSDVELLRWTADWLDRIDPILKAVFTNPNLTGVSDEDKQRMGAWLEGRDVQEHLREIAARLTVYERVAEAARDLDEWSPTFNSTGYRQARRRLTAALTALDTEEPASE